VNQIIPWLPFNAAGYVPVLELIFLSSWAVTIYAITAPLVVGNLAMRVLEDRVGWVFGCCLVFAGLICLLKSLSDFLQLIFPHISNGVIFEFFAGLALVSGGIRCFKHRPPSSDVYGDAKNAAAAEVDAALKTKPKIFDPTFRD
jgi:hypothetical protein